MSSVWRIQDFLGILDREPARLIGHHRERGAKFLAEGGWLKQQDPGQTYWRAVCACGADYLFDPMWTGGATMKHDCPLASASEPEDSPRRSAERR